MNGITAAVSVQPPMGSGAATVAPQSRLTRSHQEVEQPAPFCRQMAVIVSSRSANRLPAALFDPQAPGSRRD